MDSFHRLLDQRFSQNAMERMGMDHSEKGKKKKGSLVHLKKKNVCKMTKRGTNREEKLKQGQNNNSGK